MEVIDILDRLSAVEEEAWQSFSPSESLRQNPRTAYLISLAIDSHKKAAEILAELADCLQYPLEPDMAIKLQTAYNLELKAVKTMQADPETEKYQVVFLSQATIIALWMNDQAKAGNAFDKLVSCPIPIEMKVHIQHLLELLSELGAKPTGMVEDNSRGIITNLPRKLNFLNVFISNIGGSKQVDVITSGFEISSLLLTNGLWQLPDSIRIIVGTPHGSTLKNRDALTKLIEINNTSIESFKSLYSDLYQLTALRQALVDGRLDLRLYTKDEIHGAAYHFELSSTKPRSFIGSAELTTSGLKYPMQLTSGIGSESSQELKSLSDSLYKNSSHINHEFIELIDRHIKPYLPYDVYIKSLFEYFRGREVTTGVWEEQDSRVYPILSDYQKDGYRQLLHIASKYGGALLCDGVGLGKTFIALMLIERLVQERKRIAIIVPKSTREAVWEVLVRQYIPTANSLFGNQVVIYNHTDLLRRASGDRDFPSEMEQIRDHCDAIIIDEAHHFRNLTSKRNEKLYEITGNKMVFLLTATPINNSLFDLQHLMDFFVRKRDNRFENLGINSVRGYLIQKERAINTLMNPDNAEALLLQDYDMINAERILRDDTLFREIVVQRSRSYVREREKSSAVAIQFPDRQPPRVAKYSLKATYGRLLDELKRVFLRDDPLLKFPIYFPLAYRYKPSDKPEDLMAENQQKQLVGLVRTTMLKRFESSWVAFQYTCEDILLKYIAIYRDIDLDKYNKWLESNSLWLLHIERHMAERYEYKFSQEDTEEEDFLANLLTEPDFHLDKRIFRIKDLLADMEKDMNLLISFLDHLRDICEEHDTKVQRLKELISNDALLSRHKVVIFTEYRDTARYIYQVLKKAGIRNLFEIDSSTKVDRLDVIRRFAPNYNYLDEQTHQKALAYPIRVLITTDILAEGLNLQEAFLLINYDLHWNPVRLMQRIGRVDRRMNPQAEQRILASRPEEQDQRGKMWFWNFLPPSELEDILSLYNRVSHKVLRISETTGLEGQQLLTPDDHFKTLKDFNAAYEGQPSTEERLRLLLNSALQENPDLEDNLEAMPFRLFSNKKTGSQVTGIFACYRLPAIQSGVGTELGELKWYFLPDASDTIISSMELIDKIIVSQPETPRSYGRNCDYIRERLLLIERHVKAIELKSRRSVTMSQMGDTAKDDSGLRLIAWMDVNKDEIETTKPEYQ